MMLNALKISTVSLCLFTLYGITLIHVSNSVIGTGLSGGTGGDPVAIAGALILAAVGIPVLGGAALASAPVVITLAAVHTMFRHIRGKMNTRPAAIEAIARKLTDEIFRGKTNITLSESNASNLKFYGTLTVQPNETDVSDIAMDHSTMIFQALNIPITVSIKCTSGNASVDVMLISSINIVARCYKEGEKQFLHNSLSVSCSSVVELSSQFQSWKQLKNVQDQTKEQSCTNALNKFVPWFLDREIVYEFWQKQLVERASKSNLKDLLHKMRSKPFSIARTLLAAWNYIKPDQVKGTWTELLDNETGDRFEAR